MKKIQMMLAMMLMAFVGFALQSCGSDDNDDPQPQTQKFSWEIILSDPGTLSTEEAAVINEMLASYDKSKGSNTGTLEQAKAYIDKVLTENKAAFEAYLQQFQNEDKFTLSFILKDEKGAVVYTKYLKIDGLTVTIQ